MIANNSSGARSVLYGKTIDHVLELTIALGSDFRDMFDVRGYTTRARHGRIEPPSVDGPSVWLRYVGLDRVRRSTEIRPPGSTK